MMFEQQENEAPNAWYQRLKAARVELEAAFRVAKEKAGHQINFEKAKEKLGKGQSLLPSEVKALIRDQA